MIATELPFLLPWGPLIVFMAIFIIYTIVISIEENYQDSKKAKPNKITPKVATTGFFIPGIEGEITQDRIKYLLLCDTARNFPINDLMLSMRRWQRCQKCPALDHLATEQYKREERAYNMSKIIGWW